MDNETLDRLGATPLADGLKRIADINKPSDLFAELARLHVEDVRCVREQACAAVLCTRWRR
jgi:predicted metalloendopeptidase